MDAHTHRRTQITMHLHYKHCIDSDLEVMNNVNQLGCYN